MRPPWILVAGWIALPRKRLRDVLGPALLAAGFTAFLAAAAPAGARPAPDSFADLAERLLPAVVNVSTTQRPELDPRAEQNMDDFFREYLDRRRDNLRPRATALGSGFIIDSTGYIVTNNHVVEGADEITVRLYDEQELQAKLVGRDEKTDLALLKVESINPLPSVPWGDSEELRIGDWVLAIGNPFGLGGSVTAGIVSARHRDIDAGPYDDFIQTDASINKGNSGGPMFNMEGEVIGINTAIYSPTGISVGVGFAIPAALAKNIVDQLRLYGRPRRGWLGVRIQSVNEELAEGLRLPTAKGALIANVTTGGPAERAGMKQGDIVLSFDGRLVEEMRKLPLMVAETPVEKQVSVVVWRDGQEVTLSVTLGELEETKTASVEPAAVTGEGGAPADATKIDLLGLSVAELSPELREKFKLAADAKGVVVTDVAEQGAAAEKELQPGDVVVEVDQTVVSSPADVQQRVQEAKANGYRVVTLLIYRQGDFRWVALRIDQG